MPRDAPDPSAGTPFFRKALSMRRFGEWARAARAKHVLAVFDSCFAGTVFQTARGRPPAAITAAIAEPVRQFLTSGDAGQEVSDDGRFRELFLAALDGKEARADANGDGYLTGTELGFFLTDRITNLTDRQQTPRYGKLPDPDYDRGDFVLAALTPPEPPKPAVVAAPPPTATPTPPPPSFDPRQLELAFWDSIKGSRNPADFDAYLQQYPQGLYAGIARNRLAELKTAALAPPAPAPGPAVPIPTPTVPVTPSPESLEAALRLDKDDRAQVQRALMASGMDLRLADGDFGRRTRTAISAWQTSVGLPATGFLDATQHRRLLDEAAPKLAALEAARAGQGGRPGAPTGGASRGQELDDCAGAGWCPRLVVVPAGRYEMGATSAERAWHVQQGAREGVANSELPRHEEVLAKPFALGKFEVTRGQFARFVQATGHRTGGSCNYWTGSEVVNDAGKSWRDPGFPQTDDHPVVCVAWEDASAYAAWLARETGKPYRLPSEAEWEYAARGATVPTTAMRYWGDDPSGAEGCGFANTGDLSAKDRYPGWSVMGCRDGEVHTARVGRYRPNAFALHDMLGNVWEWVEDPWRDTYASQSSAPSGLFAALGLGTRQRTVRGGAWDSLPRVLRSANRGGLDPGHRDGKTGFRVARSLD